MVRPIKVSVVIPVYNREAYIGEAIESVRAQTFADFELIVVDDGSTDRSVDVVRACRDPRLRLISNATNRGLPRARNRGIDAARGVYLAFLDSDDRAAPTRLAEQVAFLDRHPDHAAVGAWVDWMDAGGRALGRVKRRPLSAPDIAALRLFKQGIENTASMARTAVLREHRHDEHFETCEDFDLWERIAARHPVANLRRVLVRRRAHEQQISRTRKAEEQHYRRAIYARQLDALGRHYTEHDLERHHTLRYMRKCGFGPDTAFVDWAEAWLLGIQAANRVAGCYPEPALSHVLSAFWLKVCVRAAPALGRRAACLRLCSSPLRRWLPRGLRKDVFLNGPPVLAWLGDPGHLAHGRQRGRGEAPVADSDPRGVSTVRTLPSR